MSNLFLSASGILLNFCIFNNAAIAARYAKEKHGMERVAIIDWDVHHGNGTQDIFFEDPNVFSRPWQISMPLYRRQEPDAGVLEYECYAFVETARDA